MMSSDKRADNRGLKREAMTEAASNHATSES
jgi:hypothetical protein